MSARLHKELTKRAQSRGMTLTAYIEEILEREVAQPEPDEVYRRIAGRTPVDLGRPAADLIHQERRGRGR